MVPLVIFVDDEPNLLNGLKRSLRRGERPWEAEFAVGGEEALEIAKSRVPHAIVSDMRMPIMDGAQLLKRISKEYPRTIRIVLSGEAELDAIYRAVGVCHRFYLKPTDNAVLAEELSALLHPLTNGGEDLAMAAFDCLPSPENTIADLRATLGETPRDPKKIADLVSGNVALSAKLMQVANSQFFGRPKRISSVTDAVEYVGLDSLAELVRIDGFVRTAGSTEDDAKLAEIDQRLCRADDGTGGFANALSDISNIAAGTERFAASDGEFLARLWGLPVEDQLRSDCPATPDTDLVAEAV